jgi:hypothetical protein
MEIGPEDAARVIAILNGPSYFDALSICTYRLALWPHPWRAVHILGASVQPVQLTRVGPDSLVLETANGYLLEHTSQQARSPDEPFAAGQTIDLEGAVHVVVDAVTPDGRPQRIRLELPSDHTETMRFLNWNEARRTFTRIVLPSVGGKVQL